MSKHGRSHGTAWFMLLLVVAIAAWSAWYLLVPYSAAPLPRDINIPPGQSLAAVANRLHDKGLLPDRWRFVLLARATGKATAIKAGLYRVSTPLTPPQLLRLLTEGDSTVAAFTIVEGWNWRQVQAALASSDFLKHDASEMGEVELARYLELPTRSVEGWFFPDTYHVARGSSELVLLRRAHETMQKRLQSAWTQRGSDLPYANAYDALIMASIVEKETGHPEDRAMVAAVFVNRLKQNMRLQTDPTVIYGLGDAFDGNLRKRDLLSDTPYNTYTRSGLPPTPIAMPGLASIEAALNPPASRALYFVAKGDGRSEFSETLDAHNNAVNRYQRRRQP